MLQPMRSIWPTKRSTSVVKGSKVFVGLSGGVDSAVSAALLQQQGCEVTGVFMRIVVPGYPCTAGEDRVSAMRVATHLQMPFVEVDFSDAYKQKVFDESIAEFARGRTPNPDALCNREIKFGLFFDWCIARGADYVATGHYARTKDGLLYTGADGTKDQSYFLWAVPEEKLSRTLFPIGHLHKVCVRALAQKFELPNAARPDSQGLCFLGPVSIDEMLARELKLPPGVVLDESGQALGRHGGAVRYTLGQRHGFVLEAHSTHTRPYYVIAKDIEHNTITVSPDKLPTNALKTEITLRDINWIGTVHDGSCTGRYRYRQKLIPATLQRTGLCVEPRGRSSVIVVLSEPQYVPEGQSLVLYDDTRCLGGGVVDKVRVY
jgi:tRNA-specific 2-thiouridylase